MNRLSFNLDHCYIRRMTGISDLCMEKCSLIFPIFKKWIEFRLEYQTVHSIHLKCLFVYDDLMTTDAIRSNLKRNGFCHNFIDSM